MKEEEEKADWTGIELLDNFRIYWEKVKSKLDDYPDKYKWKNLEPEVTKALRVLEDDLMNNECRL